jgi:hypothetical protein
LSCGSIGHFHQKLGRTQPHCRLTDLPSDRFGADFALNYFNPNSKKTLGEQIESYLKDKLGATKPREAPNYYSIPRFEAGYGEGEKPLWTNKTTVPMFTRTN